jgi:hypothetical protein
MKKILLYTIIPVFLFSCEKVLDKHALNTIDSEVVWESKDLTDLYLNNVYSNALPKFAGNETESASDESFGGGAGNMLYGMMASDVVYGIYSADEYLNIRDTNIIIAEMDKSDFDEEFRLSIKGQAIFLRAWIYWELVKYYGGVPLLLDAQDPYNSETLYPKRESAKVCIEQIVSDLDVAIECLPEQWSDYDRGRVTRGAAAALKGRVLLYYASPQFNPDNNRERWQEAYNANKTAKEICKLDGYELYDDFANIFIDEEKTNEAIFISGYDKTNRYHDYDNTVRPGSVRNGNTSISVAPNWDLVKSFPMKDGKPIEGHPDYNANNDNFWKNRDPRFYATIAYNACVWDFDGSAGRRQWIYEGNTVEPAAITKGASPTGFYCRKNVNSSIGKTQTIFVPTDWIEIRLAEVYLNLAECAAELGQIQEAKDQLILIRERAGIEAGDGSYGISASNSEEMVEAVMLERKIELAFENKRHWDLRRRNMFKDNLGNTPALNGTKRHGIVVKLDTAYITSLDAGVTGDSIYSHFENIMADTINFNENYELYFNTTYNIEIDQVDINYLQPKYNFYYIPLSALDKNENLQQTIHWGTYDPFDPLAD